MVGLIIRKFILRMVGVTLYNRHLVAWMFSGDAEQGELGDGHESYEFAWDAGF
jgi:hypothetical protein